MVCSCGCGGQINIHTYLQKTITRNQAWAQLAVGCGYIPGSVIQYYSMIQYKLFRSSLEGICDSGH